VTQDLWLEEDPPNRSVPSRRRRPVGVAAAALICLAVVAAPIGLIVSGGSGRSSAGRKTGHSSNLGTGPAAHQLLSALNATTDSGNFEVSYTFGGQASGAPATTPTTTCTTPSGLGSAPVDCASSGALGDQPVTGNATVDVQPFAMVATSDVSGLGTVVLRDNGTDVWEEGGGNYGLSPGSTDSGPGSLLTGFASLVEGTLGARQGALAMLGLASPTGYLSLDPTETNHANLVGTDTVDGVTVNVYQIFITPAQGGQVPGLTTQEQQATSDALAVLRNQGYTGSTVRISVDSAGFIRRTQTTDHFADGSTMTSEAEFSDFGCASTVVMPGQTGATSPPVGCTSLDNPDTATAPSHSPAATAPVPATTSTTTPLPESAVPSTSTTTTAPHLSTTSTTSTTSPPSSQQPLPGPTTTLTPGSGSRSSF
jgi:hypothetical protein